MYNRVAEMSPYGQGSILMLENLLPRWKGKVVVLCLLGFAATSFVITITLSAPMQRRTSREPARSVVAALSRSGHRASARCARRRLPEGFRDAITVAVGLVVVYLLLNIVVVANGLQAILEHPGRSYGLAHVTSRNSTVIR